MMVVCSAPVCGALCFAVVQATCSLDGRVRIYESTDVMNLSVWPLVEEFEASKKDCFAVSWNPNPFDPPMLAVGSQSSVKVWEYHHKYQKWQSVVELDGFGDIIHDVAWAPNMGRTYHLIATASKDGFVRIHKISSAANKTPSAVQVSQLHPMPIDLSPHPLIPACVPACPRTCIRV